MGSLVGGNGFVMEWLAENKWIHNIIHENTTFFTLSGDWKYIKDMDDKYVSDMIWSLFVSFYLYNSYNHL